MATNQQTQGDMGMSLVTLFTRFMRPEGLRAGTYATKFRTALKWYRMHLGREPSVGDLADLGQIRSFFRFCLARGQSVASVRMYRCRLIRLQRYAVEKGLLSECPELPSVVGRPKERATAHGLPNIGTLEHYYQFTFRPEVLAHRAKKTCEHYEAAVKWFGRFREGRTELDGIDQAAMIEFERFLERATLGATIVKRYAGSVRKVLVHAGVLSELDARRLADPGREAATELAGSLEHFLATDYVFSRELADGSVERMRFHIRAFGRFLGRFPMLADLERKAINGFFSNLETLGRSRATMKGARDHLLALWRAAWDAGLIEEQPRGVRKIRLDGAVECWTPAEVSALLRAADRLFVHQDGTDKRFQFSAVSNRLFWRSLILAGWDGGQRLGDTLGLRTDKLTVLADGAGEYALQQRKSKRWIRFALRAETVEAIRECCESGEGEAVGRVEPWRKICKSRTVQHGFRRIVENAMTVDGIRYGSFQWLRRSSVTARECIATGAGTLAAGHGSHGVTVRHYIDTKQLPAAPLPPAVIVR